MADLIMACENAIKVLKHDPMDGTLSLYNRTDEYRPTESARRIRDSLIAELTAAITAAKKS